MFSKDPYDWPVNPATLAAIPKPIGDAVKHMTAPNSDPMRASAQRNAELLKAK